MSEKKIETKTIKTAEVSNADLTGKIDLPKVTEKIEIEQDKTGSVIQTVGEIKWKDPIQGLPQVTNYPAVPAPAPQVPPAEVGVASPLKSLVEKEGRTVITPSGYTSPFVHGGPIAENEPVDNPFVGFNGNSGFGLQELISNADKVSLDKFLDFKTEVIKAFRHLGLDTRRHFTE